MFKWLIASPWILVSLVGNFVLEELSSRDFFIPSFFLPAKGVPTCSDLFLPLHKNLFFTSSSLCFRVSPSVGVSCSPSLPNFVPSPILAQS